MTQDRTQTLANTASRVSNPVGGTTTHRQFVINLCTLTAPITVPQPRASRLTRYRFFLSRAWMDGQRKYQLNMGYFSSVAEADKWLITLKRVYPSAHVSEAPDAQPDLMTDTRELRVLNIGDVGAIPGTSGVGISNDVGNPAAPRSAAPGRQPASGELPATRELFVRDAGTVPRSGNRNSPSLEDTLDELRTREFDMGTDDDLNTTGVRHLRIEVQPDATGGRSRQNTGARVRK
jgi:hypothetical protein